MMQKQVLFAALTALLCCGAFAADVVGPVVVLSDDPLIQIDPEIAYHPNRDEALVVWDREGAGDADVMGRLIDGSAQPLGPEFVISDSPSMPNYSIHPEVIYEPSEDRYLVLWTYDYSGGLTDLDVVGRFIPASGPDPALQAFVIADSTEYELRPRAAVAPGTSEVMIVWTAGNYDDGWVIEGRRWAADGSGPVTGIFPIASGPESRWIPDIAWNEDDDEFLVVYELEAAGPDLDVYGSRMTFSGSVLGSEIGIAGWSGDETGPRVASCKGNTMVMWTGAAAVGPNVYARPVLSGGSMGTVTPMPTGYAYQQEPSLTCHPWTGAFHSARELGAPGIVQGIFGTVLDAGGRVRADEGIRTGVSVLFTEPDLDIAGDGKTLAVWRNGSAIEARWIDIDIMMDDFESGDLNAWDSWTGATSPIATGAVEKVPGTL